MRMPFTPILSLLTFSVSVADGVPWWNESLSHRVPVRVVAAKETEKDFPVQVTLDFGALAGGKAFDPASVRVVEVDPATGSFLRVAPSVFLPSEASQGTPVRSGWVPPYLPHAAPTARASSESPQMPVGNVTDTWILFKPTLWEPSAPLPPWIVSLDFGKPVWINSLWTHYPGHPSTQHCPLRAEFQVATQSADGVSDGAWEKVGDWDRDNTRISGQYRAVWFAPRKVQCARLVIHESSGVPWIDDFRALAPVHDPEKSGVDSVNWIAEGATTNDKPRLFFVYFRTKDAKGVPPPPAVARVGIIREGEASVYSLHGIGFGSGPLTDADASGTDKANILSCPKWTMSHAALIACFPVTLPANGKWCLHLRVRGNLKEHPITVFLDNHPFFNGTFTTEGSDWTIISLPPRDIPLGVHYLEMYLVDTQNQQLDLDYALLTNDEKFLPRSYLRVESGNVEVKP